MSKKDDLKLVWQVAQREGTHASLIYTRPTHWCCKLSLERHLVTTVLQHGLIWDNLKDYLIFHVYTEIG